MTAKKKTGTRRISDEVVKARTGKSSKRWYSILDKWGMKKKGHTLTARHLREKYRVSPWWAQVITIRYEWERGLRKKVQKAEQ